VGGDSPPRRSQASPGPVEPSTSVVRVPADLAARVVRVLPDLPAVEKAFDYSVPAGWSSPVRVGTRVRVDLGHRRVRGWVVADEVTSPPGVELRPLVAWRGFGPSPEIVSLARWAAWRWAGRPAHFLATASPERVVRELPAPGEGRAGKAGRVPLAPTGGSLPALIADALGAGQAVVQVPPASDLVPLVEGVLEARLRPGRSVLVLSPSVPGAAGVAERLSEAGWPVALLPGSWAEAAAGGRVVVGSRAGAWGPAPGLAGVVVCDAHDQAWQGEAAPTWVGWVVAAERAQRAGAPCLLTSPCPTVELLAWGELVRDSRASERRGWAVVDVVDRRKEDPRAGLLTEPLVRMVRRVAGDGGSGAPVLCVLNRTGRARLLACASCGELARCEVCGGAMAEAGGPGAAGDRAGSGGGRGANGEVGRALVELVCRLCAAGRPALCTACGSTRLKVLKAGVSRVREELEALAQVPVAEVTGDSPPGQGKGHRVVTGTEAVLHRVARAGAVAFLDFDQELAGTGFRANEEALAQLCRAARLVGGRDGGGRVLVQTRLPHHEVVQAALHADPGRLSAAEAERRSALRLPPESALALVSGVGAEAWLAALRESTEAEALEVLGPSGGRWLVRAPDHQVLCDALARVPRPRQGLRVAVDPWRA
jgi:primosomal protein N' (replication factor Y)